MSLAIVVHERCCLRCNRTEKELEAAGLFWVGVVCCSECETTNERRRRLWKATRRRLKEEHHNNKETQ